MAHTLVGREQDKLGVIKRTSSVRMDVSPTERATVRDLR